MPSVLVIKFIDTYFQGRRWTDLRKQKTQPAWTISLECDQANFGVSYLLEKFP